MDEMQNVQNVTPATENEVATAAETPISSDDVFYADTDTSVTTMLDDKAPILSPAFLGAPTAPTPPTNNNSTRIATTAFVKSVCGVLTVNSLFPDENGNVQLAAGDVNAAAANHSHAGYAATSHNHDETYAGIGHTHAEYVTTSYLNGQIESHTHSEYAAATHNHDEDYAALNHSHTGFAAENHTHTDFAAATHDHDEDYAALSHTHSNYAASGHTHTAADVGAAAASHTHADYAASTHNHDSDYADIDHTHTASAVGAAAANHTHTAADVGAAAANHAHSNYAATNHDHDADYAPKSHTHDYAASGHTHTAADVGAATANHTHTPASIGAAPATHTHDYAASDHTHTPASIGAAAANHTHTAADVGAATVGHTHTDNVLVEKASSPNMRLKIADSARETRIYKNASATADFGTVICDYDNDGARDRLTLSRAAALDSKLMLTVQDGESNVNYKLYGEHHKPTADEVGALPTSGGTVNGDVNIAGILRVNGQQSFYFQTSTMSQTVGTNNATGGTTICCGASADVGVNGANMKSPNVLPRSNNAFTLGNTNYRWKGIYSTAAVNVSSDERMKRDIAAMDEQELAAFVNGLNVVSYNYKDDEAERKARIGLVAQQVQQADPELAKFFVNEDENGMLNLSPADLVFPLIAAVKQLSARVAELEANK